MVGSADALSSSVGFWHQLPSKINWGLKISPIDLEPSMGWAGLCCWPMLQVLCDSAEQSGLETTGRWTWLCTPKLKSAGIRTWRWVFHLHFTANSLSLEFRVLIPKLWRAEKLLFLGYLSSEMPVALCLQWCGIRGTLSSFCCVLPFRDKVMPLSSGITQIM